MADLPAFQQKTTERNRKLPLIAAISISYQKPFHRIQRWCQSSEQMLLNNTKEEQSAAHCQIAKISIPLSEFVVKCKQR